MTPGELVLNAAVLALVLFRNLGTRPITRRRFRIPVVIIVVVGLIFLRHPPTTGHDSGFEALGFAAGVILGVAAGFMLRLRRSATGVLVSHAGATFAALWVAVIVGRVAFSEGATHLYTRQVADWSISHEISGSQSFTVMFVLMALSMIGAMTATLAIRTASSGGRRVAPRHAATVS